MDVPIYIVGAGAIGLALAACLQQAKKDVVVLHARQSEGRAYTQLITMVGPDGTERTENIRFSFLSEFSQLDGIILLANKSFGNTYLAQMLAGKTGQSPLVLLQNGLTVEQPFLDEDFPGIYRCVLLATSQTLSATKIRYKPVAESPIGVIKGEMSYLDELVDSINTPGFPFRAELNIQLAIWEKVIINAVFNSVCPLLNVDNGVFQREPKAFDLAKEMIQEGVQLAAEMGIVLNQDDVERRLRQISSLSDGQFISTLVDINQHRQTELETLNSAMVRLAERINKTHLIRRIKVLGELTKLKSDLSRASELATLM